MPFTHTKEGISLSQTPRIHLKISSLSGQPHPLNFLAFICLFISVTEDFINSCNAQQTFFFVMQFFYKKSQQ